MNKPHKGYQLSESEMKLVEKLFSEGRGSSKIGALAKLPVSTIRRHLKSKGLVRTRDESIEARPSSWDEYQANYQRGNSK